MRLSRNVRRFSQPLSITTCTDRLIQNDPGFVELSLERVGENFDLQDFVYAIQTNHTVRHVCFSGTFVRELEINQWRTMLEAAGQLQALEELQIWCSTIPVDALARTLSTAKKLVKLYFFRVTLDGDQAAFDGLAESIRYHQSLRDVRIGGFEIAQGISLDNLTQALGQAPVLETLSLQIAGVQSRVVPFSADSMSYLFQSDSLCDLYLTRLGLQHDHLQVVAQFLPSSTTLRVLDLFGNNIPDEYVILLAEALEKNKSLETLVLPCPNQDMSVESCAAISKALKCNTTLQTLNLPRSNVSDDGLEQLTQGLTVNTTLKKVEVGVSSDMGDRGMMALLAMLEQNYELERLVLSSAEQALKEKIEYYMRLNSVGRGSLLRGSGKHASREDWVEMLITVKDDLDCLFYFTSMNPALCQFANNSSAHVIATQEYRRANRRHTIPCCDCAVEERARHAKKSPQVQRKSRRASAY